MQIQKLRNIIESIKEKDDGSKVIVAYSGGLDSTVLLHLLVKNRGMFDAQIRAIHINHSLQQPSDGWAEHCRDFCRAIDVPLQVVKLDIKPQAGESMEIAARNARYSVFEENLKDGGFICMAHHANDQVETFFQRLMRGSGVKGLTAIPQTRRLGNGHIFRPLLEVSRNDLHKYAVAYNLNWIEDPSNKHNCHDRNLIRNEIIPQLEQRWPSLSKTIARTVSHCNEAQEILEEVAAADLSDCSEGGLISLQKLSRFSEKRQKNLLRYWIDQRQMLPPEAAMLEDGLANLKSAAEDKNPQLLWEYGVIRRYRGRLYLSGQKEAPQILEREWDLREDLCLSGIGRLYMEKTQKGEVGINPYRIADMQIRVAFRQGGEKCRLYGRNGSHSLKKIFQEQGVPPWQREILPLLYVGENIVCVTNCCYCQPYAEKDNLGGRFYNIKIEWS
ncbi:MAG: tRNA lysidine(34) synthetase TilS [Gammaproteobacteria bacterium]|nr:MAG: tRNA lysidine(34) synthetase TilS [Gammaproteobacteria bacterium]